MIVVPCSMFQLSKLLADRAHRIETMHWPRCLHIMTRLRAGSRQSLNCKARSPEVRCSIDPALHRERRSHPNDYAYEHVRVGSTTLPRLQSSRIFEGRRQIYKCSNDNQLLHCDEGQYVALSNSSSTKASIDALDRTGEEYTVEYVR